MVITKANKSRIKKMYDDDSQVCLSHWSSSLSHCFVYARENLTVVSPAPDGKKKNRFTHYLLGQGERFLKVVNKEKIILNNELG